MSMYIRETLDKSPSLNLGPLEVDLSHDTGEEPTSWPPQPCRVPTSGYRKSWPAASLMISCPPKKGHLTEKQLATIKGRPRPGAFAILVKLMIFRPIMRARLRSFHSRVLETRLSARMLANVRLKDGGHLERHYCGSLMPCRVVFTLHLADYPADDGDGQSENNTREVIDLPSIDSQSDTDYL